MAVQSISKLLRPSGDVTNKPLDARTEVNSYNDLQNLTGAYVGMHVYVKNNYTDSLDILHTNGEYVVTEVDSYGDITNVITAKEYFNITDDYADFDNKPQINSVTLIGNKTATQLGLQAELVSGTNIKTINNQSIVGTGNISIESGGTEVEANPTGEAITPLNKIKIGDTNYNIPQTDTSNLATEQELQQGLSGKQDTISDLQQIRTRADEGHTALQPKQSGQYTQGDIVIFDANGGLADSQKKTTDFAPIAQAVPTPQSGDEDKILGYETQGGVQWVTRPQNGQDGANGKSAYDLYVDDGGTLTEEQWLASLKANIGAFKFVANVPAVETSFETNGIGTPYTSPIDTITADASTASLILLMNTATATPAKTYMIATQETATAGTYEFVYAGNLQSAMPSNVLTEDNVDATQLVNPESGSLAKAEDAMQLKVKLEGVTASEEKNNGESGNGYIKSDGTIKGNSSNYHRSIPIGNGVYKIRFLGICVGTGTNSTINASGYSFYDSNDNPIAGSSSLYDRNGSISDEYIGLEYVLDVPQGAVKFRCSTFGNNRDDFYCYLQSGESVRNIKEDVEDIKKDIYGYEGYVFNDEITEGFTNLNGRFIDGMNTWNPSGTANSRFIQIIQDSKIRIENTSDIASIYAILNSVTGYDVNNTAADYFQQKTAIASKGYAIVDVPAGKYIYNVTKSSNVVIDFKLYLGEIGHIDGLTDKVVEVVDNLDSNSPVDALSAKQGKRLNDLLFGGYCVEKEVDGKVGSTDLEIDGWSEIIDAAFDGGSNNYKWSAGSEAGTRKSRVIDLSKYKNAGFTDIIIEASASSPTGFTFVKEPMDTTQSETLESYEDNLIDYMNGKGLASIEAGNSTMISLSEVEDADYLYIKIKGITTTNLTPSKILFLKGEEIKSVIPDISNIGIGLTHLAPDNIGQLNAVKRMRKLTDIRWTPAFDISRGSSGGGESFFHDVFKAGTTYEGIPYSRSTYKKNNYGYGSLGKDNDSGFKVGITISLETFITAISNRGTVMELESIFNRSSHNTSFYSNICAGAACAACGLPYIKTNNFDSDSNQQSLNGVSIKVDGNTYVFTCIGRIRDDFNLKLLKLGDIMALNEVHTVLVTDVIIENDVVKYVEVGELTTQGNANYNDVGNELGGHGRRLWWSVDDFVSSFNKYKVLRYNGIADTPYTPSPYAPMADEQKGYAPYTMAVLPYMGNKFRYVAGATNLDDILKVVVTVKGGGSGADKVYSKKYLSITRKVDGQEPVEFIEDIPVFGENDDYVYVVLNDDKYKVVGEYEAFAFVEREWDSNEGAYRYYCSENQTSSSTGKTSKCNWSVVETLTNLEDY